MEGKPKQAQEVQIKWLYNFGNLEPGMERIWTWIGKQKETLIESLRYYTPVATLIKSSSYFVLASFQFSLLLYSASYEEYFLSLLSVLRTAC